jgi:hypothetical protein
MVKMDEEIFCYKTDDKTCVERKYLQMLMKGRVYEGEKDGN